MQGLIAMLLGYGMKLIVAQRREILVNQVYSMYQDANSFTMLMAALFMQFRFTVILRAIR